MIMLLIVVMLCGVVDCQNVAVDLSPQPVLIDGLIATSDNLMEENIVRDMFALFLFDDSLNFTPPVNYTPNTSL
jgi:hypothetical protein